MRYALLVAGSIAGCRGQAPADATPAASAPASASATAPGSATAAAPTNGSATASAPTPAPLTGFFESLPVAGHPDAFVSLPTGATGKRPVVVVIHGAGDRPDWQCGGWRRATGEGRAFIVCPTGHYAPGDSTPEDKRYTHTGGPALLAYVDASLAALEARWAEYADTSTPLLAGFSLGSYAILDLAVKDPARFPRIALVEGATTQLDDARARAYVKGGGQRVLFGCGQRGCEAAAKATAARLTARDGLEARVVYAPVNHTFDPPLEDAVHGELAWLVEGDPRWEATP